MTADAILERLKGELPVTADGRPTLALVVVGVGGLAWKVIRFLDCWLVQLCVFRANSHAKPSSTNSLDRKAPLMEG